MNPYQSIIIRFFVCFLILGVTSCSHTAQENNIPTMPAISLASKTPPEVFALLNESADHFLTARASGELEIKDLLSGTSQKCSCVVLIKNDGTLLIKGYQPLIPNYFTFIIRNGNFTYYIPRKDTVYQGAVEALKSNKNYTLSLDPELLLTAFIPPHFSLEKYRLDLQGASVFTIAELKDEGTFQTITTKYSFTPNSTLPRTIETVDNNGVKTSSIELARPTTSGKITYPKMVTIVRIQQQTEIRFSFNKLLFNSELPDRSFDVDIPEGVTIEEIKK
jgi:outer membrane lipoprotein-sorting protein